MGWLSCEVNACCGDVLCDFVCWGVCVCVCFRAEVGLVCSGVCMIAFGVCVFVCHCLSSCMCQRVSAFALLSALHARASPIVMRSCSSGRSRWMVLNVLLQWFGIRVLPYVKPSATGTRTRVARVRAEYPNQLDYGGF